MKKKRLTILLMTLGLASLLGLTSSCGHKDSMELLLLGQWGCETYISCRTFDDGSERWDTLHYQVGAGHGYEMLFFENGSGKFCLNDSPALIKRLRFTYELDEDQNEIVMHLSDVDYLFIGSQYLDENEVRFDIHTLNDTILDVTWINVISEEKPFFEHFYLKKIIP